MMDISFVIVNYKSFKYLNSCLSSISKSASNFNFEIIIVNNDQERLGNINCVPSECLESIKIDLNKNKLSNCKLRKKFTILEVNKNIGFGRASNIGALFSCGRYFCFINPDVEIVSGDFVNIIENFSKNFKTGIIGPKIIEEIKGDKLEVVQKWSVGMDLDLSEILLGKFGLARSNKIWERDKSVEVDWVTGACLFIRKKVFLEVGGFDENFFLYFEDVDLCKRVKSFGNKVVYFPEFKVLHLGGKSSSNQYQKKLEYFKSQDYFYKKWFSGWSYFILKFLRFFYFWRYKL